MRLRLLLAMITFLAAVVPMARAQQSTKPLTSNQVMELVKAGMDSAQLAGKVKQAGIDFDPTDAYLQELRQAGAQDVLIRALRDVHPKPLTREQVLQLVAGGVPSERAAALVKQHGIDFDPDPDYLETLRVAGANETLLAALRSVGEAVPSPGTVRTNSKDGLKYVWIPPGTFQMGCSAGDSSCQADERPAHTVAITRGFWMGQSAVTVGAYKHFSGSTGSDMPPTPPFNEGWSNAQMPVVNVTWDGARAYCEWAGGRLPTEAEWEYAARGGSAEARYGDLDSIAWYSDNSGGKTHVGGEKRANSFGLYDALGNENEWVSDWYDAAYYATSPSADPLGPSKGKDRIIRGGCWYNYARFVRVSARYASDGAGNNLNGVRCVWKAGH